jgi:hypothetical protein
VLEVEEGEIVVSDAGPQKPFRDIFVEIRCTGWPKITSQERNRIRTEQ